MQDSDLDARGLKVSSQDGLVARSFVVRHELGDPGGFRPDFCDGRDLETLLSFQQVG